MAASQRRPRRRVVANPYEMVKQSDGTTMRVTHSERYWSHAGALPIYEADIIEVLADSGWYNFRTMQDTEPKQKCAVRYRFARVKWTHRNGRTHPSDNDPVLLTDGYHETTPGGMLTLDGRFEPAKDKTPYLSHDRRVVSGAYEMDRYYLSSKDLFGKKQQPIFNTHPRFTQLKTCMRKYIKVCEKRAKILETARLNTQKRVQYK